MNADLHRADMLRRLDDDLMRQANFFGFIAVGPDTWGAFVKLAFARDAYKGFVDLMGQRTLNVAEMTLCELGTVVYGSDCPVARAECLAEIDRRRDFSRREM